MILTEEERLEVIGMEDLFQTELEQWKIGGFKVKLIVLGEAPLSCAKYFYGKNRGTYLSGLRATFGVPSTHLLGKLREKGILAIDLYKYPIATSNYDQDKTNSLFDQTYLKQRIEELDKRGLLSESVKAVFRYKKLISRKLPIGSVLSSILVRDADGSALSLFIQERPNQLLSTQMEVLINSL